MAAASLNELARRICVANHRAEIGYPKKDVPCSVHIQQAKLYYGLIQEPYAKTLKAINDTIAEVGLEVANA